MARTTVGQKAQRVLRFVMGARNPRVVAALQPYGFSDDELGEGMNRLQALARARLGRQAPAEQPKLIAELDAFESRWFQVARAALEHRFPRVAELLFSNLGRATGVAVALMVRLFLERLAEMEAGAGDYGAEGVAARAFLAQRGLTSERVAEAQALLERLDLPDASAVTPAVDESKAAEQAMWSWYLEWSTIARVAIRDKRLLRALGFRRGAHGANDDEVVVAVVEPDNAVTSPGEDPAIAPPVPPRLTSG